MDIGHISCCYREQRDHIGHLGGSSKWIRSVTGCILDTGRIFYDYKYVSVNEQLFGSKIEVVSVCFHSFLLGASSRLLELLKQ